MVREIVRKNENGRDEVVREEIYVNGKKAKLRFTMPMWFKMEEEITILDDLYTMLHSKGRFKKGRFPALVELMTDGDITEKDVLKEKDAATIRALLEEVQNVITKAVTMKEKKYDDDSIHDEVLEEIEKKETRAD